MSRVHPKNVTSDAAASGASSAPTGAHDAPSRQAPEDDSFSVQPRSLFDAEAYGPSAIGLFAGPASAVSRWKPLGLEDARKIASKDPLKHAVVILVFDGTKVKEAAIKATQKAVEEQMAGESGVKFYTLDISTRLASIVMRTVPDLGKRGIGQGDDDAIVPFSREKGSGEFVSWLKKDEVEVKDKPKAGDEPEANDGLDTLLNGVDELRQQQEVAAAARAAQELAEKEANTRLAEQLLGMARSSKAKGDVDSAIQFYKDAIAKNPDLKVAYEELATLLKEKDKKAEYIAFFGERIDHVSPFGLDDVLHSIAEFSYEIVGTEEVGIRAAKEGLEVTGKGRFLAILSYLHEKRSEFDLAIAAVADQRFAQVDFERAQRLAELYGKAGRIEAQVKSLEEYDRLNTELSRSDRRKLQREIRDLKKKTRSAEELYAQGRALRQGRSGEAGKHRESVIFFRRAIDADPEHLNSYTQLADLSIGLSPAYPGEYHISQVIPLLEPVVERHVNYAEGWRFLAQAYRAADDSEKAIESYRKALAGEGLSEEQKIGVYFNMGLLYKDLGKRDAALANFKNVFTDVDESRFPDSENIFRDAKTFVAAIEAEIAEEKRKAEEAKQQPPPPKPDAPEPDEGGGRRVVLGKRGGLRINRGEPPNAPDAPNAPEPPAPPKPADTLPIRLGRRGRGSGITIVRQEPKPELQPNPEPPIDAPESGDTPKLSDEEAAARAKEHYARATEHYNARRYREAIDEMKKAYALQANPKVLTNIGVCYRKMGDFENALQYYRSYLRDVSDAENKAEIEEVIREIEAERAGQAQGEE